MSAVTINIAATGEMAGLARLNRSLKRRKELHARIAVDVLETVKVNVSLNEDHKTANKLGATPTGHLQTVASQIESASTDDKSTIKVPRASRLAAAFGPYTVRPSKANGFLTIPVAAEAYGRRARTFGKLDVVHGEQDGRKGLYLALPVAVGVKGDTPPHLLYLLIRKAEIKEDRSLLPFDEMLETAVQTTGDYIEELTNEATGGTPS